MQEELFQISIPQNFPEKYRPSKIEEVLGNKQAKTLISEFKNTTIQNVIFFGKPGSGKTTLARCMAEEFEADFIHASAAIQKTEDIRRFITQAKSNKSMGKITILFLDEIHRFSKTQQDTLLPYIEDRTLILVGATTENPFHALTGALTSRCLLCRVQYPNINETKAHLKNICEVENITFQEEGLDHIINLANNDTRKTLQLLELCSHKEVTR